MSIADTAPEGAPISSDVPNTASASVAPLRQKAARRTAQRALKPTTARVAQGERSYPQKAKGRALRAKGAQSAGPALSPATDNAVKHAIIYCRVSDKKQARDGDGLNSQEHRCREYAAARGYVVDAVFNDDVSGGGDFMKRSGMVALLRFLKHRKRDDCVVIFDDLKRFARDTIFHRKRDLTAAWSAG